MRRPVIDELGRNNATNVDRFAVDVARFIENAKTIARAQIVIEIDVAGENVR